MASLHEERRPETWHFSWIEYDLHNQPISDYNIKDGSGIVYAYGVNGERIRKYSTKRNDTYYVPGADGRTEVILNHPYAKDVTINLWGNDNLGQIRVGPGNEEHRYYYLKDHLGSIRATVDESGTVTNGDDYYPFGMAMDSRTMASGKVDTKLKFTSKERDTETGYDYFGARYYDARIGRLLSVDRFTSKYPGLSPYNYAANNPIIFYDAHGDSVVATDAAAQEAIRNTLPEALRKYVVFDKTGKLDVALLETQKSDDCNFIGLLSVGSDKNITVVEMVKDNFQYKDQEGNVVRVNLDENSSFRGLTFTPDVSDDFQSILPGKINVQINGRLNAVRAAQTVAHELFGHVRMFNEGKGWLHSQPNEMPNRLLETRVNESEIQTIINMGGKQ